MGAKVSRDGDFDESDMNVHSKHPPQPTITPKNTSKGEKNDNSYRRRPSITPSNEIDLQSRMDATLENREVIHGGMKIQYAWVSHRGYYPDEPNKDNQDSYTILPTVRKKKPGETASKHTDIAFFAVYDGHGKYGHLCSWFTRDNLAKQTFSVLAKTHKTSQNIKAALWDGHVNTNEMLHNREDIDDKLSGTTAISVLMCDRTIFVSNIGDSRAVLLSIATPNSGLKKKKDGIQLVPTALSSDQTPYRKDERERVKAAGARVLSTDQLEGLEPIHENWGDVVLGENIDEGGDPPRIWHSNGGYPGTAFTRSIGDRVAETLGVYAEPEILEYTLTEKDKYIVIASDGVWEFLTNQMVADLVAENHTDPLQACKRIVTMSYELWLQYEVRTDDITIIILKIDDFNVNNEPLENINRLSLNSKRMSGDAIVTAKEALDMSAEEKVSNRIKPNEITTVIANDATNESKEVPTSPSAETVVRSPRPPTGLTRLISQQSISSIDPTIAGNENNINMKPVRRAYSKEKRKHLIVSTSTDKSLEEEEDFNIEALIIPKNDMEKFMISNYLQKTFLFQHLSVAQLNLVVNVMKPIDVHQNDIIIKQGDAGDCFYIIDHGIYEVRVLSTHSGEPTPRPSSSAELGDVVYTYESGPDFHPGFGELSLMYGKPRAASVIAKTDGKLWSLDRRVFRRVVLRSADARKQIIKTLQKVELLKSLSLQQIQRLADLLNETKYKTGEYIIKQGEVGDCFYIILSGICDCTKILEGDTTETFLVQRREHEYFGERALLNSEPRAANVIARTDVRVLYIHKTAFDEVLGSLADIINEDRIRRETLANAILQAPKRLEGIDLRAVVCNDNIGPLILGSFRSPNPNLSVRTFLLSEVDRLGLSDAVINFVEAVRLVALNQNTNPLLPRIHSASRDTNAIHLLYREPVVGDLSSICQLNNRTNTLICTSPYHTYVIAAITSALETLHSIGIIYRTVQPESIHIDIHGRVLLMDYRVCKITTIGRKTYTICGASEYLAPEQISQIGHTTSVDLWSLGVLMYELVVGKHPFAMSQGEIATYTRIASYGTPDYPHLEFPSDGRISNDAIDVINGLIRVEPESRLGFGNNGFAKLQSMPYFDTIDFEELGMMTSPFKMIAEIASDDLVRSGMDNQLKEAFGRPYEGSGWDKAIELCR